jgi:epsilon-lactone hydrolase
VGPLPRCVLREDASASAGAATALLVATRDAAMLRQFAADYLAGADPKTPLASPLFASLAGLPPLLIQVGTADLLLSDSERLAAAAAEAGVDVTLQIGEGLPHVYPLLLGTPEAAEATEQIGKFLRARAG